MVTFDGEIGMIEKGKFKLYGCNYDRLKVYSFYDVEKDNDAYFSGFNQVGLELLKEIERVSYHNFSRVEKIFISSDRSQIIYQDNGEVGLFHVHCLKEVIPTNAVKKYLQNDGQKSVREVAKLSMRLGIAGTLLLTSLIACIV